MHRLLCQFWQDERGSLFVTEWVFVATILMLGILSTAVSIRQRTHRHQVQATLATGDFPFGLSQDGQE